MSLGATMVLMALAGAPLADVSPYEVKHRPDGSLEYWYDFTAVKAAGLTADASAVHGEKKVRAFLDSLPRSTRVLVAPAPGLEIGAGRPVESGQLTHSFATISDGPMTLENPLGQKVRSGLRAGLDPREPHLLLSAEAVAWQVRALELSALAAEEIDTEALRRELWTRVLDRALERARTRQGDAREGALALAARLSAGLACLDAEKIPATVLGQSEAKSAAQAEILKLGQAPEALLAPAPWNWRPDLECAWVRARVMGLPFEPTRAGTAAVLTFLELVGKEPKLGALWQRVRARRDRFLGWPESEPVLEWRDKAGQNPGEKLDDLSDFIQSLPVVRRLPPPLVGFPVTPMAKFLGELSGPESDQAFVELASAMQDGRFAPALTNWPSAREAALAPLCLPAPSKGLVFDGAWRERFAISFMALVGSSGGESGPGEDVAAPEEAERTDLVVRLLVPPALEVEPLPELYAAQAVSLERMIEAFQAEQLSALEGMDPDGQRSGAVVVAAKTWLKRLRGLAALASPANQSAKELSEARRFAAAWQADPGFSKEVREASAAPVATASARRHAAIVGVSRRELTVNFASPPKVTFADGASSQGLVLSPSEQRYIVPVLVTVGASAPVNRRPLDRPSLRALVEGASGQAVQLEGAFIDGLSPTSANKTSDLR